MLKKLVIAAVAVVIGLVVVKKTQLGTLMKVWWRDAVACVDRQVPPETRIKQLQLEIAKIDDSIRSAVDKKIDMMQTCKQLSDDVEALKQKQEARRNDMKALLEGLETVSTRVTFKGESLRPEAAQEKLDSIRAQFENGKVTLKNKEQVLRQKQEQLDVATRKIDKIKDAKMELTALVAKLETELELLRLKQVENGTVEVDDSQVSKCFELSDNLKKQIAKETLTLQEYEKYGLTPKPAVVEKEPQRSKAESIKAARQALNETAGDQ
jgi:hypothetical protein